MSAHRGAMESCFSVNLIGLGLIPTCGNELFASLQLLKS